MIDEVLLYDGTVKLSFDSKKHVYTVGMFANHDGVPYFTDFRPVPSITTILKVIGKGDALTQWAANCAADYIRECVAPGERLDEIAINALADGARFAFRRKSKEACDIGTLVHKWIEAYLVEWFAGRRVPEMPVNDDARRACNAALDWLARTNYKPQATEMRLYSLKHGYAGTADAQGVAASINGKLAIVDWKTSKAIYPEYRFQTAAYAQAHSEMTG